MTFWGNLIGYQTVWVSALIGAGRQLWWPGVIANRLDPGTGIDEPSLEMENHMVRAHHAAIIDFHGEHHGNRIARKHVGWTIDRLAERQLISPEETSAWRRRLLQTHDNKFVANGLAELYGAAMGKRAA